MLPIKTDATGAVTHSNASDFTLLQTGLERVDTFINNWRYTTVLPSDHYQAFVVALGHLFPNMK